FDKINWPVLRFVIREYISKRFRMSAFLKIVLVALALTSVPALAQNNQGQNNNNQGGGAGASGPLVGAGLPVLLIGGGIYWIVRRKKGQARFITALQDC